MKGKVNCTCGWSWNKSDSSAKDMYICHECGRDNSNNIPKAQEGIKSPNVQAQEEYFQKRKKENKDYNKFIGNAGEEAIDFAQRFVPGLKNLPSIGSTFAVGEAEAYNQDPSVSDEFGMIPLLPAQIASAILLEAETEKQNRSDYAKNKYKGKDITKLVPEKELNNKVIDNTYVPNPKVGKIKETKSKQIPYKEKKEVNKIEIDNTRVKPIKVLKKENGGWLDSYASGGTMQEYQENYNDSKATASPDMVGDGFSNVGRNYSSAWGGQFEDGGEIPQAQWGLPVSPLTPLALSAASKVKSWFSDDELAKPIQKPATKGDPRTLNIVDPRKKMATTNQPLRPNSDLVGGKYNSYHLDNLIHEAKRQGLSKKDIMNLSAMGFQETKWAKTDPNIGHVLRKGLDPGSFNQYEDFVDAYKAKMKEADRLGIKDPVMRLQVYNGMGTVTPKTEKDYHGFEMQKIYGVPIPKGGINMKKNPLYGKQVTDIRDNVLAKNPEYIKYMDSIYKAPLPKYMNDRKVTLHHEPRVGQDRQLNGGETPQAQTGGSIPGSVGFTYARTKGIPSNGPYAKKTLASAQNGKEMQYYQNGLDFKPKSISRDGGWLNKYEKGGIIKDDRGQWEHPGEITEIGSNQITMQGVPYPVLGISNTGDVQMMYPDGEYEYDGESVTEFPMAQNGSKLDFNNLPKVSDFKKKPLKLKSEKNNVVKESTKVNKNTPTKVKQKKQFKPLDDTELAKLNIPEQVTDQISHNIYWGNDKQNYGIIDKENNVMYYVNPEGKIIGSENVITGATNKDEENAPSMLEYGKTANEYYDYLKNTNQRVTPAGVFTLHSNKNDSYGKPHSLIDRVIGSLPFVDDVKLNTLDDPSLMHAIYNEMPWREEEKKEYYDHRKESYGPTGNMFRMVSQYGVPSSKGMHGTGNTNRIAALNSASADKNLSNGCINVGGKTICNDILKDKSKLYILPEVPLKYTFDDGSVMEEKGRANIKEQMYTMFGHYDDDKQWKYDKDKPISREYIQSAKATKNKVTDIIRNNKIKATPEEIDFVAAVAQKETKGGKSFLSQAESILPGFSSYGLYEQKEDFPFLKGKSPNDEVASTQAVIDFYRSMMSKHPELEYEDYGPEKIYSTYTSGKEDWNDTGIYYGPEFRKSLQAVKGYKNGGNINQQDQKTLEHLDQLTNFTNYNKQQPAGWLSKYN